MAKFKIIAGVPDFDGTVGEKQPTRFIDGTAEVDVVDGTSASRLAYFISAGYGVEPLDDVSAADAIRSATASPEDEARYLEADIERLKRIRSLDKLRAEHAKLSDDQDDQDGGAPTVPDGGMVEHKEPPSDAAPVAEWRAYGVSHLDLTEEQAAIMTKAQLQQRAKGGPQ
jgi:hypothetical protein